MLLWLRPGMLRRIVLAAASDSGGKRVQTLQPCAAWVHRYQNPSQPLAQVVPLPRVSLDSEMIVLWQLGSPSNRTPLVSADWTQPFSSQLVLGARSFGPLRT